MDKFYNKQDLKNIRIKLRNQATPAERLLWQLLKSSKSGYKFRRQHSLGNFVVDFYCAKEKLAVELDGDVHYSDEATQKDKDRTKYLNENGIRVVRFDNDAVMHRAEAIVEKIIAIIEEK